MSADQKLKTAEDREDAEDTRADTRGYWAKHTSSNTADPSLRWDDNSGINKASMAHLGKIEKRLLPSQCGDST